MTFTQFLWGLSFFTASIVFIIVAVAVYDVLQRKHAILRNFPVVGHFRYLLEMVGPELRQYIVTDNDEERPFSRDQRRWVYASAKGQNNNFGFGTDNDLELQPNYLIIKHRAFPIDSPKPGDPKYDPSYSILGYGRGSTNLCTTRLRSHSFFLSGLQLSDLGTT
ncbi:MAG: glutamate synthase domain-containing protein 2 [Verrucomicrobiales bacterium]|jgi:glutamate synthase domain-containing protein 2